MDATIYRLEWRFGGQWSRLAAKEYSLAAARECAQRLFLPPTKAHSRPPVRIVEVTTTERVVEEIPGR